jgi:hypothetical protein
MRVILLEAGLNTRQRGRTVMARSIVLLVLKFIKVENHLLLSMAVLGRLTEIAEPAVFVSVVFVPTASVPAMTVVPEPLSSVE